MRHIWVRLSHAPMQMYCTIRATVSGMRVRRAINTTVMNYYLNTCSITGLPIQGPPKLWQPRFNGAL